MKDMECKNCGKAFEVYNINYADGHCSKECWINSEEYTDKSLLFDYLCMRLEPMEREMLHNLLDSDFRYIERFIEHLELWLEMDKDNAKT